jgi:cytochrome c2
LAWYKIFEFFVPSQFIFIFIHQLNENLESSEFAHEIPEIQPDIVNFFTRKFQKNIYMIRYLLRNGSHILPAFLLTILIVLSAVFAGRTHGQAPDPAKLFQPCAACHTIGMGKLIGPDLKGMTERRDRAWLVKFIANSQAVIESGDEYAVKLFEEYNKIPMPPAGLTDEEINILIDYIENYNPDAAAAAVEPTAAIDEKADGKPYIFMEETRHPWANFRLTFLVSLALILISLIDLFLLKIVKAKFVHIIIILISAAVITEVTILESQALGRQQYYEPDQPIAFSHYIHAGQHQIDCKYCHTSVTESKHAGFPSPQLCLNCHNVIRKGTHSGTEEIAKIHQAVESGKSIEWIKVHNLPDHAYFNHAQHVVTGKLDCTECHGDVAKMDRIMQVSNLSMGWCIECHRTREVQFLENDFYSRYLELHEQLNDGRKSFISVDDIGGTNCSKCHY